MAIWNGLADALCGGDPKRRALFRSEGQRHIVMQKRIAASFPLSALEQRLHELSAAGLSKPFVAVAVRQGMDQLIAQHCPTQFDMWKQLADSVLPLWAEFGRTPEMLRRHIGVILPIVLVLAGIVAALS
jgi:hypothetical protein